jgi:hypothetical protein
MIRLELLYHAEVTLGPPQELGETPQGRRRIIPITGGTFIYATAGSIASYASGRLRAARKQSSSKRTK